MEDVIFKLGHMQSALEQLLNQKGIDDVTDLVETLEGNGIFHVVADTLLWGNETVSHIVETLKIIDKLKPQIQQMLKEFATANKQFASQASALIKDCTQFQKETEITNEFCR